MRRFCLYYTCAHAKKQEKTRDPAGKKRGKGKIDKPEKTAYNPFQKARASSGIRLEGALFG
jgi:hypothetical protein